VYIKTNKETQTTTDIQNKTRYPPRFGRLLRHSASIRRRFMLQIPTPNSASEMTYIVSGGALNSTHSPQHQRGHAATLKGLPRLRIHHCASYSKQRYKGKGKVRRKPPLYVTCRTGVQPRPQPKPALTDFGLQPYKIVLTQRVMESSLPQSHHSLMGDAAHSPATLRLPISDQ